MLESTECGKPISQARADVKIAGDYFKYYGEYADKLSGSTIPVGTDTLAYTLREPHGVTGHIVPWNYPIQIAARTLAPALAVGNCCVVKPAEHTSITTVLLGLMALESGLPPGVLNVVLGFGAEVGRPIAEHPGVRHLSFTGSAAVGRDVMRRSAAPLRPVTLELGGKSPHILFEDCDTDAAVPAIVNGILQNAGQTCSAGSRVIVQRRLFDEMVSRLEQCFQAVTLGRGVVDPDLGPLISGAQLTRVLRFIDAARGEGAEIVTGGERAHVQGLEHGYFVQPTLVVGAKPSSAIAQEEVFGPVLVALPFEDDREAVALANSTRYGLIGAVWTGSATRALAVAGQLECGQVFVNSYGVGGGVGLPFGRVGESGFGREKGMEAMHEYSRVKSVVVSIAHGEG